MPTTVLTHEARLVFLGNHFKGNEDECWPWLGSTLSNKFNYGRIEYCIKYQRFQFLAHRISYLYYNKMKELDNSIFVCHSCDNPICVNPKHLFLGTNEDNMRDKTNKGRTPHGINHWYTSLTEEDIIEIRYKAMLGISRRNIAKEYKLDHQTINNIVNGTSWKHIKYGL